MKDMHYLGPLKLEERHKSGNVGEGGRVGHSDSKCSQEGGRQLLILDHFSPAGAKWEAVMSCHHGEKAPFASSLPQGGGRPSLYSIRNLICTFALHMI